jgi:TetR/AcrR family transcriptional regulator, transcriptional repressor of aconitase
VPKRSEEHLQARREQILAGARRAFSRYGYEGATVARLEEEIGLSRGAIFNYYPSKLDLFVALSTEDEARILNTWMEQGFEAALREIAEESPDWLGVYLENGRRLRTDEEFRKRWKSRNLDLEQRTHAWLAGLQERGEIRDDMPLEQVGSFFGLVLDGVALHVSMGFPVDVEPVLALVRAAIAPPK